MQAQGTHGGGAGGDRGPGRCSRKGDLNLGVKTDQSTTSKRWRGALAGVA